MADPVIRVLGELPGTSRPFGINRVYKGSQGTYEEVLVLVDPDGVVIWESHPRFVELRGAMFEDLFRRRVDERIPIISAGEHTLVFYLDGQIAGRVPVFIDAPESVTSAGVLLEAAETALKKGSICWIRIAQPDGSPSRGRPGTSSRARSCSSSRARPSRRCPTSSTTTS